MSSLQPLETIPLGDRAFESIRAAIVTVELLPGAPLKDRELAEMLGLSRTPVREALRRLEAEGLVETRGRSGWIVAHFDEQDVHELFELRRLLEPAGLDRLEQEPDDSAIRTIATFFDGYQRPVLPERFNEYFRRDHEFHSFIVSCSHNQRLTDFYDVIGHHIIRGRHYLSSEAGTERIDATLDEHNAISRAVQDRDFARAREALLSHLRTGHVRMLEQLDLKLGRAERPHVV